MAKFRKKARRMYGFAKKAVRHRSKFGGGLLGDVLAGGVVGAGVHFGASTIRKYVPAVGPVGPIALTVTGVGVAGKLLHKGGKFTDAALMVGTAMIVDNVLDSVMGGNAGSGGIVYQ